MLLTIQSANRIQVLRTEYRLCVQNTDYAYRKIDLCTEHRLCVQNADYAYRIQILRTEYRFCAQNTVMHTCNTDYVIGFVIVRIHL